MKSLSLKLFAFASIVVLASCGGGGDDGASNPAATSYWTMDAYSYQNGGSSATSTAAIGTTPVTVAVVSTATLNGGDKSNGAFSGSSLSFSFKGTAAGIYQVVASKAALVAADPTTLPIVVENTVGIAVTTGATLYTASAGQVKVTVDSAGKFHFDSVGALPTVKTQDVIGGVTGALASMSLTIHDAY